MTRLINKLNQWNKRRKKFRQTFNELSALSDRDLHDMGLNRSDIYSVAHKHSEK